MLVSDSRNSQIYQIRSRRPDMFCEKGVLRNFTKFIGKHLCQSRLLIKFLRTPFSQNISGRLLLIWYIRLLRESDTDNLLENYRQISLVVKVLGSQSRGLVFKITGWTLLVAASVKYVFEKKKKKGIFSYIILLNH